MVLSLATCKIESCPCGDLHVITAALVVSSFLLFFIFFIFSKEGGSKFCLGTEILLGFKGLGASLCTKLSDVLHSSPRISCALTEIQSGKGTEEENPFLDMHSHTWLRFLYGAGA